MSRFTTAEPSPRHWPRAATPMRMPVPTRVPTLVPMLVPMLAWMPILVLTLMLGGLATPARAELTALPDGRATKADAASAVAATPDPDARPARTLPVPPRGARPGRAALHKMIDRAADQYGLERDLVHAVVMAESGYDPHAVSPAGAVGVMQVMPATAADYGVGSTDALFDPQTNIRTGVRHLKRLIAQHGIGKAVMAYNAGEGALARHNGFVTYGETQRYTHRVLSSYLRKKGLTPYSPAATALTGVALTPAMASAGGGGAGGVGPGRKGRQLRKIDVSRLSLRVRPTLSNRALDPAMHRLGPDSQPMFVLETR